MLKITFTALSIIFFTVAVLLTFTLYSASVKGAGDDKRAASMTPGYLLAAAFYCHWVAIS